MNFIRTASAATLLTLMACPSFAQVSGAAPVDTAPANAAKPAASTPAVTVPNNAGEIWAVTTVTDFVAARETTPKRERQQELGCFAPGEVTISKAAEVKLPPAFQPKCWVASQRAEPMRQQVKYACSDSTTAEAATRQNADGSFGSQIVLNIPERGGISVTRTMKRAPGKCDLSKVKAVPVTPMPSIPRDVPAAPIALPPK